MLDDTTHTVFIRNIDTMPLFRKTRLIIKNFFPERLIFQTPQTGSNLIEQEGYSQVTIALIGGGRVIAPLFYCESFFYIS